MPESVTITINGTRVRVPAGCMVSAAILRAGVTTFRRSLTGEARGPLCGMGVCFECRVTIDGVLHRRACLEPCRPGMSVTTHD